jgi:NitT/TauT family transport system substrate-binding protein
MSRIQKIAALGLIIITVLSILLSGCKKAEVPVEDKTPLKVGALSMMTVLPLYVAQQENLFKGQGVNVEIVPFRSQIERDTALNTGQIDGIVDDIYIAPVFNKDTEAVKVVAVSQLQDYMFAIVASKQSKVNSVEDLKNVEIASSLGNIIEYVTDQMCLNAGLKANEIKKISVAKMVSRLEMLNQGQIEAASFSRPLSDMAILGGGKVIIDDSKQSLLTCSIMISTNTLKARPDDVKNFMKAWTKATQNISADPVKYLSTLVKSANIAAELADKIVVPKFDMPRAPTKEEYQPKLEWNLAQKNISKPIPLEDIYAPGYLP